MRLQKLSKITVGAVAISTLVGLALAAVVGGPYKLAYRMQKDQYLKYAMSMKVDQSMEIQGSEMTTDVEGVSSLYIEVENTGKDGSITFVYSIDTLLTHVKSMQLDTTFMNPQGLVGKRTRLMISATGKKLKSVVVDSVKLTGMFAQLAGGRQSTFNLIELPENEVKIGDFWTNTTPDTSAQSGGKVVIMPTITYRVAAEVDTLGYKCLRLNYNGKIALKGEGTNMGMNFFVEGEGPTTGIAYFAPKEGLLVAVLSITDLEMTIALTGQMSMTIPQSTSTKTLMVLGKSLGQLDLTDKIFEELNKTAAVQKWPTRTVCSVCASPAVFWCSVRKAWFCHEHAGKTYTPGGGYRYKCN